MAVSSVSTPRPAGAARRAGRAVGSRWDRVVRREWTGREVVLLGLALVLAQLAFRAWVVLPAWFFLDDYNFMTEARGQTRGWAYFMEPYGGHLMPGGRAVARLVGSAGPLAWGAAATSSLLLQAAASLACLWMLVRLVGPRPMVLVALSLYLTTVLTLPGFVWWVAALTLLPVQAALFVAVGAWVQHLRGGGVRPLLLVVVALLTGLAFDVRAVLTLPVLGFVALAWFASGGPVRRVLTVLRRFPTGFGTLLVLGLGYSAVYLRGVESVTTRPGASSLGDVASTMLGVSLPTGLLGGPWRWEVKAPPTAFADPPTLLVGASWAVLALVVAYLALRRTRTLRAWALLAAYAVTLTVLVASTRSNFGSIIGREYRFLTEVACVAALSLVLATCRLPGAVESSEERVPPRIPAVPRRVPVALLAAVLLGSVVSSVSYARIWHTQNASDAYLHVLRDELAALGPVDLAETVVPEDVLSQLTAPLNTTRTLAPLASPDVDFPGVTSSLAVVTDTGRVVGAMIEPGVLSQPGPVADCGWQATGESDVTVPLQGRAFENGWWIRVGYLSSAASPVSVTAGGQTVAGEVHYGLGSLFVRVEGTFDEVEISGLDDEVNLCVDVVEVGQVVPGGPL